MSFLAPFVGGAVPGQGENPSGAAPSSAASASSPFSGAIIPTSGDVQARQTAIGGTGGVVNLGGGSMVGWIVALVLVALALWFLWRVLRKGK